MFFLRFFIPFLLGTQYLHRSNGLLQSPLQNFLLGNMERLLDIQHVMSEISDSSFDSSVLERWKRSSVVTRVVLFENQGRSLSIVTIPARFTMPLHTQPGSVVVMPLYGSVAVRHMRTCSVEGVLDDLSPKPSYLKNLDAFAIGDDDCVCRGGMCPRRYGCAFWVEKQVRDNGAYFIAKEENTVLDSTSTDIANYSFHDGPREYAAFEEPTAVLELFSEIEADVLDRSSLPGQLLYYTATCLTDPSGQQTSTYKVQSSLAPLGYAPMHVPYNGPDIVL
jgi:hypothetical protein